MLLSLLAACAQPEFLLPKSAMVPTGTDLSGTWRLRDAGGNDRLQAAERAAAEAEGIPLPPPGANRPPPRPRNNRDSLVHVFLETGRQLKITQTSHGLFVSFDRAVVEEYRYGENRVVSVGPVQAQRVSGWEAGGYVIETLDREGNRLVERYRLAEDGRELKREVQVYRRGTPGVSVVQAYERVGPA